MKNIAVNIAVQRMDGEELGFRAVFPCLHFPSIRHFSCPAHRSLSLCLSLGWPLGRSIVGVTGHKYFALFHPVSSLHLHLNSLLRTQLLSSSSLLVSAKEVCQARSATLAAHIKMWIASVRVGVVGLGTTSFAGMCRIVGVRAIVSEAPTARVGAVDTDGLPVKALMEALEAAGPRGPEVSF